MKKLPAHSRRSLAGLCWISITAFTAASASAQPSPTYANLRAILYKVRKDQGWFRAGGSCDQMIKYLTAAHTLAFPAEYDQKTITKAEAALAPLLTKIQEASQRLAEAAIPVFVVKTPAQLAAQRQLSSDIAEFDVYELAKLLATADEVIPASLGCSERGVAFYEEWALIDSIVVASEHGHGESLLTASIKREQLKMEHSL